MASCYHPYENTSMRVWFLARAHLPFSPASVHARQIGGGEIALYYVAKGLAGLGHDVVVVNRCGPEAGLYDGVRYYDAAGGWSQWRSDARARPPDVLVVSRRMLDVFAGIPARAKVYWTHDYQGVPMRTLRPTAGRQLAVVGPRTTGRFRKPSFTCIRTSHWMHTNATPDLECTSTGGCPNLNLSVRLGGAR